MLRAKDVLFGEIAVALELLTREQLDECVALQRRARRNQRLGNICEERGYLTRDDVQRVLQHQSRLVQGRTSAGGGR